MDFTAEVSGTVGVAYSGELTTKISTMVAEVNLKYGISISMSITAKLGNVVHVKNVPPGRTVHAQYGVWRRKFSGLAYWEHHTCYLTKNNVTGYGPLHVGWYTWDD
ncbi:hypothetical protein [Streptomyces sp. NPDC127190]|uniref:hypothetical protein n=1 Tax=unclassified Streptomyces TaxID=2593676 RepID=UPI0036328AC6